MNYNKKKITIAVVVLVLTAVLSSVTLAFLLADTEPVINTLEGTRVACEVVEASFDGVTKTDVTVRNTGEVESYIRAMVVTTWMSEDGTKISAQTPQEGADYTLIYASDTAWKQSADGFWYYAAPVAVGESTEALIENCTLAENAAVWEGFYLSVEVVASAIQSTPAKAVTEKWSSGVSGVSGGTLIIK